MATAQQPVSAESSELESVLKSEVFSRAPALSHLLTYLCEKVLKGEGQQIKEYSIAVDVFGRKETFDQESSSIVRVQANRLRKHLTNFYGGEGASHKIRITIPVGQYAPVFETVEVVPQPPVTPTAVTDTHRKTRFWIVSGIAALVIMVVAAALLLMHSKRPGVVVPTPQETQSAPPPLVGLPAGDEVRIA